MDLNQSPRWRRYELLIQDIFKRTPGAQVESDADIVGRSGRLRKVELWVRFPFEIRFAAQWKAQLEIRIAVDCKDRKKPVGIKAVEEFLGQVEDVGAHVGIIVSTRGFDEGARARAKEGPVFLVETSRDLLELARGLQTPEECLCKCCSGSGAFNDCAPGIVSWWHSQTNGHEPVTGECSRCSSPHVMCPDCAAITGFDDGEFGKWIECNGTCGYLFKPTPGHVDSLTPVERRILVRAGKRQHLTPQALSQILRGSRWQFASANSHPLRKLERFGWIDVQSTDSVVRLTENGARFVDGPLADARQSVSG